MAFFQQNTRTVITCLLSLLMLSGCGTLKYAETNQETRIRAEKNWLLKARMAVNTNHESASMTLNWQQNQKSFDFHVYGLLGVTYAHLIQTETDATLELKDNQHYKATSAEQLLKQHLGWPFPIEALSYWVKGISYGHAKEIITRNTEQQITSIQFDDWQVNFSQYRNYSGYSMPRLVKASHPTQGSIKILVKKWLFNPHDSSNTRESLSH